MSFCFERRGKPRESLVAAELRVEPVVVDDVVAVRAAGPRLEEGRGVEMRDAELLEVGRQRGGVVEAEGLGELQPVGGERHRGRHQAPPLLFSVIPGRAEGAGPESRGDF